MARGIIDRALRLGEGRKLKEFQQRVEQVNLFEPELELLDDAEIRERADELRQRAREDDEPIDDLLPEAFGLVREASKRSIGQRHYDVQLIGGMVLHSGTIAEMKTGEGKTLTATLAVFLNTLAGDGVHVVTVNDYLARRDALWMKPIYDLLGVSVGVIQSEMDPAQRRQMYAADVTYGTNSEFGFDYLRDNMASTLEECVQREHVFAIVDEVDNILIDEARTPLIISGRPEQAADTYYTFARLAKQMVGEEMKPKLKSLGESRDTSEAEHDYEYDEKHKTVAPTEGGVDKAEKFLGVDNLYISEHGTLVNHLIQSLKAESLFKRDTDYAVIDGEVKIIDEFTGRILEGRRWSDGLHQAVEAKEGVAIREENQTLATITLQNYFRLYDKLAGMTGTAITEATEFMKIYEVAVVEVDTHRPMVRADHNDQIYKTPKPAAGTTLCTSGTSSRTRREPVRRHRRRGQGLQSHAGRRGDGGLRGPDSEVLCLALAATARSTPAPARAVDRSHRRGRGGPVVCATPESYIWCSAVAAEAHALRRHRAHGRVYRSRPTAKRSSFSTPGRNML